MARHQVETSNGAIIIGSWSRQHLELLGHGTQYDHGFLWEERCAEKLRASTTGGVSGRVMPRNDISSWAELDQKEELWWLQNWENGLLHSLPRRQPSSRKEGKDVKNVNWWWPPLIHAVGTIGSPSCEAAWRPSLVLCAAPSPRPAASSPDLLPLPTGVGFLPGFEHVKEKVRLKSAVDANNELGSRGFSLRGTSTAVQRLALAGVASQFSSLPERPSGVTVQDAVTLVLGKILVVSTKLPQENLLSSSAAWSRCRAHKLDWSLCGASQGTLIA